MERQTIFDRNAVESNMRLGIDTLMRHIEAVGRTAMQCELERLRAELEQAQRDLEFQRKDFMETSVGELRAENEALRKTRREAMEQAASDAVDGYVGAKYLDAIESDLDSRSLAEQLKRELDAREES